MSSDEAGPKFQTPPAPPTETKDEEALAVLQTELEYLRNSRNEERFLYAVIIIILVDALIFSLVQNWAGALVIGVTQIFGIAVLARKLQIEEIPQILSKFLDRTAETISQKKRDE